MEKAMVKKRPLKKFFVFGILSVTLYYLLITHQELVKEFCSKGKWYAFFPIITAFIFSFVHGNFTDAFWSVLGIEQKKKRKEVK